MKKFLNIDFIFSFIYILFSGHYFIHENYLWGGFALCGAAVFFVNFYLDLKKNKKGS